MAPYSNSLAATPEELLESMLLYLAHRTPVSASFVCKSFHRIVQPFLYKSIDLRWYDIDRAVAPRGNTYAFCRSIWEHRGLSSLVEELMMNRAKSHAFTSMLYSRVEFPQLTRLHLDSLS